METVTTKTILSKVPFASTQWFGIDYNMNLYRGCCHGCIYCDSRSNCYQITNFDQVKKKENILELLTGELMSKRNKGVVGLGAMSDTYNPFEKQEKQTRQALKLIHQFGYGVSIDTKSDLIVRDIDLLSKINQYYPVIVKFTVTTMNSTLASKIEPHASSPLKRMEAMKQLSQASIFTGILLMPILPFLTDNIENLEKIIEQAYLHGAKFVYFGYGVTLRENQRDYYYQKLDSLFPGLTEQYQKLYGNQYFCIPENQKQLIIKCQKLCEKYGLYYKMNDIIIAYKTKKQNQQLQLF